MAKRYTESTKFRDPWYRNLTPVQKCLWEYLISECSHAGIIEIDKSAIDFHIGAKVSDKDFEALSKNITWIAENKIFMPSFVAFQQGTLSRNNNAHKNIFVELEKYGITETLEINREIRPSLGSEEGLPRPPSNVIVKVMSSNGNVESARESKKHSDKKGTRLADDWKLTKELGLWAEGQGLAPDDVVRERDKFRDYWRSKAGANGIKLDWDATWRNWIRQHLERKQNG